MGLQESHVVPQDQREGDLEIPFYVREVLNPFFFDYLHMLHSNCAEQPG
jgi:hypothetical protein